MANSLQRVFAAHMELGKVAIQRGMRVVRKRLHGQAAAVFKEATDWLGGDGEKVVSSRIIRRSKDPGLVVSVAPYKKSMHTNRYGQEKPAGFWLEHGTKERCTKGKHMPHTDVLQNRVRAYGKRYKAHNTGRISPAARSMEKAATIIDEREIDNVLVAEIMAAADKVIKKHGL